MATKTYILAPNFTYKPTGPIQIGSIIADPFRPAKSLSQPAVPPAVETVVQHNHEASRQNGRSARLSLWAHALDIAGARVDLTRSRDLTDSLSIDRLETRYLAEEPTDGDPELALRLREPRVRAAIDAGLYGRAPVYLISGVKIARGLVVRSESGCKLGGGIGMTVHAAQAVGVDIGMDIGGDRGRGTTTCFVSGDEDLVVAYQLHVIKAKGRKTKERVTTDIFESDAAFLHDDDDCDVDQDGEHEIEIGIAGIDSLTEVAQQAEMTLQSEESVETDGETFVCVQARELY